MGNSNKKRVFQVAREFSISHEALISYLKKMNFDISSRMSTVNEKMYEEIESKFGKEIELSDKSVDLKSKLKEKRAREEAKKLEARRDYEEKVRTSYMIMSETPRVRKPVVEAVIIDEPPVIYETEADAEQIGEISVSEKSKDEAQQHMRSESFILGDETLLRREKMQSKRERES